jgi:hypothetical protein
MVLPTGCGPSVPLTKRSVTVVLPRCERMSRMVPRTPIVANGVEIGHHKPFKASLQMFFLLCRSQRNGLML